MMKSQIGNLKAEGNPKSETRKAALARTSGARLGAEHQPQRVNGALWLVRRTRARPFGSGQAGWGFRFLPILAGLQLLLSSSGPALGAVVFEATTAYHNIRVEDEGGERTLCFDNSTESRMNLRDPMKGHFEYTEMFHLVWLWNARFTNVLMIGLGGASTQRSFEHYYPELQIETVEIDPTVLRVAKEFFQLKESPRQVVHVEDGRVFLRRSQKQFDVILMDAYTENRYGGCIPQHLATREFFQLAASHLTTNGVLAYNVMGTVRGWRADLLGAMYNTLKKVFPQAYVFPCTTSQNVVLVATKSPAKADYGVLRQRANFLINQRKVTLSTLLDRQSTFRPGAPPTAAKAPVLTDDFAPVEGLMNIAGRESAPGNDNR